jgi:putative ABC transport system substrate-binding protein
LSFLDFLPLLAKSNRYLQRQSERSIDAILPLSDPMALGNADLIGCLSLKYQLPNRIAISRDHRHWRIAEAMDRTCRCCFAARFSGRQDSEGAKPGDLPIGKPSDFELGANPRAAKALNVTIPASILGRTSHMVE